MVSGEVFFLSGLWEKNFPWDRSWGLSWHAYQKINNKDVLVSMILCLSLLKLRDETVQNLLKFKGWD